MGSWHRPKPKPPQYYILTVEVTSDTGVDIDTASVVVRPDIGPGPYFGESKGAGLYDTKMPTSTGVIGAWIDVRAIGYDPVSFRTILKNSNYKVDTALTPSKTARQGIVRVDVNRIFDDDGYFQALGHTLFWALRGWKFERDRIKQNLKFISEHGFDYFRFLCSVNWAGNETDPNWPDYQDCLAELLDYAYNELGLRAEATLIGDGYDPIFVANQCAPVFQSRQHMLMDIEMANEWTLRPGITMDVMIQMSNIIRAACPQNVILLSDAEGFSFDELKNGAMIKGGANAMAVHPDRGYGDGGWRTVRQTWDWKECAFPILINEPIGPRSSVQEETDPLKLSMNRATSMLNGCAAWVFHNGAGVAGQVIPERNRPANIFEVPGVNEMMQACRNVDKVLNKPLTGRYWNNQWAGNPAPADSIWPDNPTGVNRQYMIDNGQEYYSVLLGIVDHVNLLLSRGASLELYNPATDILKLVSGGSVPLTQAESEAYIVHGVWQ